MSITTFDSDGATYKIKVNTVPPDGKKYPMVLFVHGNAGLSGDFGNRIRSFADTLTAKGYNTAVPQYYLDDDSHLEDTVPKHDILEDAIAEVSQLPSVDSTRIGLVGFSLGAATAMSFISSKPSGTVSVLANFFGFLTPKIRAAVANFPPTVIFHNENDRIVDVSNSDDLNSLLPATVFRELVKYDENYFEVNHSFRPGGAADLDSQSKTVRWCETHLPATGV